MKKTARNRSRKIQLPYGAVKKVAGMAGVSVFTVGNVLKGESQNEKVLKAIRDYWKDIEMVKTEISNLSNQ